MKTKMLAMLVLFGVSSADASGPVTYTCQSVKRNASGETTTVTIRELKRRKVTNVRNWDQEVPVEVTVRRRSKGSPSNVVMRKGFATAYTEDVIYQIVSKPLGVSIRLFFDEMNESPFIEIFSSGKKEEVRMNCLETKN